MMKGHQGRSVGSAGEGDRRTAQTQQYGADGDGQQARFPAPSGVKIAQDAASEHAQHTCGDGKCSEVRSDLTGRETETSRMTEAVIVSTARTALAKSWRGALNMTHGATLGGHVVHHAVERARVDPGEVEDVVMGCANPEGATGGNIARQIALRAELPVSVPGVTINRFCSSGLQAIAMAAQPQTIVEARGQPTSQCSVADDGAIAHHVLII